MHMKVLQKIIFLVLMLIVTNRASPRRCSRITGELGGGPQTQFLATFSVTF